jgi:CRP/FNR family transcriptional regulator
MASVSRRSRRIVAECKSHESRGECSSGRLFQELLRAVAAYKSDDREVKAGHDIYSVGEPGTVIYIVVDGWVALYDLLRDGRRQILQFALPGALLGFEADTRAAATHGAEALTDTIVSTIPHRSLAALSSKHPEIAMRFAGLIARDRNLSFDHLTSIGRRSARERVARLLLELFIRYRAQWPGHRPEEMQLPLTQEHIGDATGLTGVHVNRVLGDLRDEGIVQFHYRKLMILDPDRLIDVAAIDPHLALSWIPRN